MNSRIFILICALLVGAVLRAENGTIPPEMRIEFKANRLSKDLTTGRTVGIGDAYLKQGGREIFADKIEVDYTSQLATGIGRVKIIEKGATIYSEQGTYSLKNAEILLEKAVVIRGQLVLSGETIRRVDTDSYVIENGSYTNCLLTPSEGPEVVNCAFAWRISGRKISITIEGYVSIYDGIFSLHQTPVFYAPYALLPIKTKRQTGFLFPQYIYYGELGSSFTPPFFADLGRWHDLTIYPQLFSRAGYHLGVHYRYRKSANFFGESKLFLIPRRYGADPSDPSISSPEKRFGIFGEIGINLSNTANFENGIKTFQNLRYVSHPYFTRDYGFDFGGVSDLGYLRTNFSATRTFRSYLATMQLQHLQSLYLSKEYGVDKGATSQLPVLGFFGTTKPIFTRHLLYEFDARVNSFVRANATDRLPDRISLVGNNEATATDSGLNDYIRTGQRIFIEPKITGNPPMPDGVQLQPVLRGGLLGYHFAEPSSKLTGQAYLDLEVPFSLYVSRTFNLGWENFEKVAHVVQPRVIYGSRLAQTESPNHPFFYENRPITLVPGQSFPNGLTPPLLSSPRFDLHDQIEPYEYFRLELINRFRRLSSRGIERFFRLQISEQFNSKRSRIDPRFSKTIGPIEILGEVTLGRWNAQMQGVYPLQLENAGGRQIRETEISAAISFQEHAYNFVALSTLFRSRVDPSLDVQNISLSFYRPLPTVFDIEGAVEYSFLGGGRGGVRSYTVGLHLRTKPLSCWEFVFKIGRDSAKNPFVFANFTLNLGSGQWWGG